ncbi:MAG: lipid-A-disaccharide synthase [Pseudoflavonifractor sp.]|nr:lipid-A-disaccharide synthase [Alloprevotella sp.]MCM1116105.1 lipid-A-disaccharide synthase [Pseudoflavonifractor sp.]
MRYFLSAGEASGDLHAGELIAALREADPEASFAFLGGDNMSAAAGGVAPTIHYKEMAFMGFSEVMRHLGDIGRNFRAARQALEAFKPDALILIDYPSFNLRLAREAHRRSIPVFYYISPKLWAWKSWRLREIRRYVDQVYSILPFEVEWYGKRGYRVEYVGNPSVEEVDRRLATLPEHKAATADSRPILALIPGSRVGEIRCNLPIMAEVARRHPELRPVIAMAPALQESIYRQYGGSKIELVSGSTLSLMKQARAALVTSGTATLECALAGTPQVALYRSGGSRLLYTLFRPVIRVPWVTLPNLIAGREVIPEMLMHRCTPDLVDDELRPLLDYHSLRRATQIEGYTAMRERLGKRPAAATTATLILANLHSRAR